MGLLSVSSKMFFSECAYIGNTLYCFFRFENVNFRDKFMFRMPKCQLTSFWACSLTFVCVPNNHKD